MLLIKNATIIDPDSKLNGKKRDLLIEKGKITQIKGNIPAGKATILEAKGACVSIGWLDLGVQVGDPGFEHRETLTSAAAAAMAGGFTAIACQPNSSPVIHSKSEVLYISNNTDRGLVDFHPIGAVSRDCAGQDITEMYDMHDSGAVAFSDGKKQIQDAGLMMRALQYVKAFDGLIINHPHDQTLSPNGQLHEGLMSTSLGMRGFPAIAEELMLQRDLYLLEYTESRLHVANISTAGAVKLMKKAKAQGLSITSSVAIMNLVLTDEALGDFDSNYKVLPPLREKSDVTALKKGLKDGTIDLINSNHIPWEEEMKNLEFPYAKFGAIGLETVYALCNTYLQDVLEQEDIVRLLAINPRGVLRLPIAKIEVGAIANLTIFHPKEEWTFTAKNIHSKSRNTPFIDQQFTGKVLGVVNKGQFKLF